MRSLLFFVLSSFVVLLPQSVMAESVLRQAKDNIKSGKNLEQTTQQLLEYVAKSETRHKDQVEGYVLAAQCSQKINEQENTKLYLNQPYDTARFFNSMLSMFDLFERADSASRMPNEKGKLKPAPNKRWRTTLLDYRHNLLNGGKWNFRHDNYAEAFVFFDTYLDCAERKMFVEDDFMKNDTLMPEAAYLATVSAHQSNNPDGVIRFAKLAQKAGMKSYLMQELLCRAWAAKGDMMMQGTEMMCGLRQYPLHPYFFSNVIDYLAATNQLDLGLAIADSMIAHNDTVPLFWYAKSLILIKQKRDREAIDVCDSCLALDDRYVDAYYNKGIASLNLAVQYEAEACTDLTNPRCQRDREIIRSLYLLAKLPMERVRALAPDDVQRWAAPLYRIYLHLNMGKEFEEMDRLLK